MADRTTQAVDTAAPPGVAPLSLQQSFQLATSGNNSQTPLFTLQQLYQLSLSQRNKQYVIFNHPSVDHLATNLQNQLYQRHGVPSTLGRIEWKSFNDGFPNLFIHNALELVNSHIIFIMSIDDPGSIFQQLSVAYTLPSFRIESLSIIVPYSPVATMERSSCPGEVVTAASLAAMFSIISTPVNLYMVDLHTFHNLHYFPNHIRPIFVHSGHKLKQYLLQLPKHRRERATICFPDAGSFQRYRYTTCPFPAVVCSKIRDEDKRIITITEGKEFINKERDIWLIDDLVHSGSTLKETIMALYNDYSPRTINIFVTHGIFENESWKKFVELYEKGIIKQFFICDTHPQAIKLHGVGPFTTISIASDLADVIIHNKQVQFEDMRNITQSTTTIPSRPITANITNTISNANPSNVNNGGNRQKFETGSIAGLPALTTSPDQHQHHPIAGQIDIDDRSVTSIDPTSPNEFVNNNFHNGQFYLQCTECLKLLPMQLQYQQEQQFNQFYQQQTQLQHAKNQLAPQQSSSQHFFPTIPTPQHGRTDLNQFYQAQFNTHMQMPLSSPDTTERTVHFADNIQQRRQPLNTFSPQPLGIQQNHPQPNNVLTNPFIPKRSLDTISSNDVSHNNFHPESDRSRNNFIPDTIQSAHLLPMSSSGTSLFSHNATGAPNLQLTSSHCNDSLSECGLLERFNSEHHGHALASNNKTHNNDPNNNNVSISSHHIDINPGRKVLSKSTSNTAINRLSNKVSQSSLDLANQEEKTQPR